LVVNSQDENSRRLHSLLEQRLSANITLYGQEPDAQDIWQIANVMKDDFQIYDRCGRLTHHLSLPYTILSGPHVEEAIRNTYCERTCGECSMEVNCGSFSLQLSSSIQPQECNGTVEEKPVVEEEEVGRGHHGGGHHSGHHGHHGGQQRGHHDHEGGSHHQHGHQGQVVFSQVQRGQVVHRHTDMGQLGLRHIDLGQVAQEAGNPQVMNQP
uniref:Selenoprotein P N-terminal domain-containing protein n=1 Tax=Astyanax mexicanus TaxID=7994 RepID=W5KEM0_ASTMX